MWEDFSGRGVSLCKGTEARTGMVDLGTKNHVVAGHRTDLSKVMLIYIFSVLFQINQYLVFK